MISFMNRKAAVVLILGCISLVAIRCNSGTTETKAPVIASASESEISVEKGHHLVIAGGCHDCHSPKKMGPHGPMVDSTNMLSGHPANSPLPPIDTSALVPGHWIHFAPDLTTFIGPWGMSHSANLTPDSATGLGAWTESHFLNAIRTGKHMGLDNSRPIMPPMPWDNFNHLPDDDIKSIFAYLKTIMPVSNRVHEPYSPAEVKHMALAK
jgi:mono/diheme cytochrome c family protein